MNNRKPTLERAFELAGSGTCPDLVHLRERLRAEGYGAWEITGPALLKQLREIMRGAQARAWVVSSHRVS